MCKLLHRSMTPFCAWSEVTISEAYGDSCQGKQEDSQGH